MFGFLRDDSTAIAASGPHQAAIVGWLLTYPHPSVNQAADFLKLYDGDERTQVAQELIANGVDTNVVSSGLAWLATQGKMKANAPLFWGALSMASAAASGYHGYKRNGTITGAAVWFLFGMLFPVFTPVIAVAQGFSKKKGT